MKKQFIFPIFENINLNELKKISKRLDSAKVIIDRNETIGIIYRYKGYYIAIASLKCFNYKQLEICPISSSYSSSLTQKAIGFGCGNYILCEFTLSAILELSEEIYNDCIKDKMYIFNFLMDGHKEDFECFSIYHQQVKNLINELSCT